MKKLALFAIVVMAIVGTAIAALPITKVDRVNPTDEIFMEMALDEAKKNVQAGGLPCGAAIVKSNRMISVGQSTKQATAEEAAIAMAKKKTLDLATIYTINEPTTEAYNAICKSGADAVVFVNSREDVIAAGVYPAEAYNDALIDSSLTQVPMSQVENRDATALLKSFKK